MQKIINMWLYKENIDYLYKEKYKNTTILK